MTERKTKMKEEKKLVRTPKKIIKEQADLVNSSNADGGASDFAREIKSNNNERGRELGVGNGNLNVRAKTSECNDKNCHVHGKLKTRGRTFEGTVTKKFHKRVVIEFERTIYVRKYERYKKSKTKIHARLPTCMENEINVGDYVKVKECRPLSKLIHFVVIEKIKGGNSR